MGQEYSSEWEYWIGVDIDQSGRVHTYFIILDYSCIPVCIAFNHYTPPPWGSLPKVEDLASEVNALSSYHCRIAGLMGPFTVQVKPPGAPFSPGGIQSPTRTFLVGNAFHSTLSAAASGRVVSTGRAANRCCASR